jgi:uncharacterized phage-like protein YoqJ
MRIGFTGHRPKKVFYNHHKAYTTECFELLYDFLHHNLLANNYLKDVEIFNTGGALGYDTAVAELLFSYSCKVNLYLPYKSYGSNWYSNADKIRLEKHKHQANQVFYNCEDNTFCTSIMYERNKSIVDNSDMIIALWDGSNSGTKHCVDYARKQKKKVVNIWDEWVNDYEDGV